MPVAESPSYHGYDVTDYYRVESATTARTTDFKRFVAEAHRRGIRVLVDMVLNHASNEHPYFKDAAARIRRSPVSRHGSASRDQPAEKGPWGGDAWHKSPVRDEYYYGIFWSGMPDLNYDARARARRGEEGRDASGCRRWASTASGSTRFRTSSRRAASSSADAGHARLPPRVCGAHVRAVAPRRRTRSGEVWDSVGAMLPYYPDQLDCALRVRASRRDPRGGAQALGGATCSTPTCVCRHASRRSAVRRSCATTIRRARDGAQRRQSRAASSRRRCSSRCPGCRSSTTAKRSA